MILLENALYARTRATRLVRSPRKDHRPWIHVLQDRPLNELSTTTEFSWFPFDGRRSLKEGSGRGRLERVMFGIKSPGQKDLRAL